MTYPGKRLKIGQEPLNKEKTMKSSFFAIIPLVSKALCLLVAAGALFTA